MKNNVSVSFGYTFNQSYYVLGIYVINGGRTLQLSNLGYKEMAGTYKCIVTGIGGQSDGSSTLEVYCKYSSIELTE